MTDQSTNNEGETNVPERTSSQAQAASVAEFRRQHQSNVRPMPESKKKRVEAGLLAVQEAEHEASEYKRLYDEQTVALAAARAEISALTSMLGRQQTEIESYRADRDHAVAKRAEIEALFTQVKSVFEKYSPRTLVDEAEHADDSRGDAGGSSDS